MPSALQALVRLVATLLDTPELPEDLREVYMWKTSSGGRLRANVWCVLQVLRSIPACVLALLALARPGRGILVEVGQAARRLRRRPRLGAAFVLVVGLGMSASSFMFQVRSAVLHPELGLGVPAYFVEWVDESGTTRRDIPLRGDEPWIGDIRGAATKLLPVRVSASTFESSRGLHRGTFQWVGEHFISDLGGRIALGSDVRDVGDLVLAHRTWLTHWAGDPGVLGTQLSRASDDSTWRIVGVAAPEFDGPLCCERPYAWGRGPLPAEPVRSRLLAVGVRDIDGAESALSRPVVAALDLDARVTLTEVRDSPFGAEMGLVSSSFALLSVLAGLAFVGTILNGANLLLADATERLDEHRTRRALGAGPSRILRGTLLEVGGLALASSVVAAAGAAALFRLTPYVMPIIQRHGVYDLELGRIAMLGLVGAAAAATLLAGLPACIYVIMRVDHPRRGRAARESVLARLGLGSQITLATVLVVVAALFTDNIRDLYGDFVGFRNPDVQVLTTSPNENAGEVHSEVLAEALSELPGVEGAAFAYTLPVYGAFGDSAVMPSGERVFLSVEWAGPGYFDLIGMRLVSGREARASDEAVLSLDLARLIGAAPSAAVGSSLTVQDAPVTIVGVAEEATWGGGRPRPSLYRGMPEGGRLPSVLLVRSPPGQRAPLIDLISPVLNASGVAVSEFETLGGLLVRRNVLSVFLMRLAILFAGICLLVALAGIYSHFLQWVRCRERDLGIRLALGAGRASVGRTVVSAATAPVLVGLTAGILLAHWGLVFLGPMTPETIDGQWAVMAIAATGVGLAALLTVLVPAVLAGRRNPLVLLRSD